MPQAQFYCYYSYLYGTVVIFVTIVNATIVIIDIIVLGKYH